MSIKLKQLNDLFGTCLSKKIFCLEDQLGPICIDSRKIKKGDFFIPLVGENFNGHKFIFEAYNKGAQGTIISDDFNEQIPENFLYWQVKDTLTAFQQLAFIYRKSLSSKIVGITGSTGKTTTREILRAILETTFKVHSSSNNNNNDFGVPLTLFEANHSHEIILVEMAMRGLGEIKRLSNCSGPDIAVITNIGSAHIGRLGSIQNIAKAKCEIISKLNHMGVVIIPGNDDLLSESLNNVWKGKVIKVGIIESNLINKGNSRNKDLSSIYDLCGEFDFSSNTLKVEENIFNLPLKGKHNAINFLISLAVAKELRVDMERLTKMNVQLPEGRSQTFSVGGITVYDETYNASPESVRASLEFMIRKKGRHFVVLGTMYELGEYSNYFHEEIAKFICEMQIDGLVLVGEDKCLEVFNKYSYLIPNFCRVNKSEEAIIPLTNWLRYGDSLLLKASRKIRLEKLIPFIKTTFNHL